MEDRFGSFTVLEDAVLTDALEKIDANRHGFVIVVDCHDHVLGVLTDGDVRRGILKGAGISCPVREIYTRNAKVVGVDEGFNAVIGLFRNQSIKFLPIVDDDGRLVNIITKSQLHALMLQDIHADLTYDFFSIDTSILDTQIFQRPWGFYKTTVLNDYYQSKVLSVRPGGQLSLQSHSRREEHWVVVHGTGLVQLDESLVNVTCGSSVFIPKGARHRLINTDDAETLIINEVQIGDYLGEDDIIRYEDEYGRA